MLQFTMINSQFTNSSQAAMINELLCAPHIQSLQNVNRKLIIATTEGVA